MRMNRTFALAICACAALPGCGVTELGLQPVEIDRELGEEASRAVALRMGIANQPRATAYLNEVGHRLAAQVPDQRFSYVFQIVDQPEPNAFAAPAGYIFVSRGLLLLVNSEDELANVLSHEIVHVAKRHVARQRSQQAVPSLITLPGRAAGAIIGGELGEAVSAPFENLTRGWIASYSREHEHEADRLGQRLAADAGYKPETFAAILDRIEQATDLETSSRNQTTPFFRTHPTTPDRTRRLSRQAAAIEWHPRTGIAPDRYSFLRRLEGLVVGPNPAQGVIRGRNYLHPDLEFVVAFPKGWLIVNTPQAVAALAPQGDGLTVLEVLGRASDPEAIGREFERILSEQLDITPSRSEPVRVGSAPGYALTVTNISGSETVYTDLLWLEHDGRIYQVTGLALESQHEAVRQAAESFRRLAEFERKSIQKVVLRFAEARSDESLAVFCERTENVWGTQLTALVNALDPEQPLNAGRLLKIAVAEPYGEGTKGRDRGTNGR